MADHYDQVMASSSKWFNSGVATHHGSFLDVVKHVPSFDRLPFTIASSDGTKARANGRLDTIVRLPIGEDSEWVPVGVVSRDYALLQHTSVCDEAKKALEDAKIDPAKVSAELKLTEFGERMKLSLRLPDNYLFDPGDKFPVTVRLECLNSVDGSTRFRAVMGWFRLICSNGLTIGITQSESDRRQVGDFQFGDIGNILHGGLGEYKRERETLIRWQQLEVNPTKLRTWVDTDLRVGWGFKAAARAFHVATSGRDVKVIGPYRGYRPTNVRVESSDEVPGAPEESTSLFDVSQVLAWLAKERADIQEQMDWREQIPSLIAPLVTS